LSSKAIWLRRSWPAVLLLLASSGARADGGPFLVVSTGELGMRREVPHALAIDLQVGSPWHWSVIRPVAGVLTSSKGGAYVYSGVAADFPLPGAFQISPGFAPGVVIASADRDLGSPIEFRSSLELSVRLESMRLGVAFSHISNARLSDHNPGVEILAVSFTFPARR